MVRKDSKADLFMMRFLFCELSANQIGYMWRCVCVYCTSGAVEKQCWTM